MSDDDRLKTYLRRLTTELQATKQELRAERDRRSEPIAIIGMGCRYPGHSDDPESFWQFLARGADGMTGIPDDRSWDLGALSAHEGVLEGGFLTGAYDFDPAFFGINPREAQAMDPHQRLVLMAAWEAMEGAGTYPEQLADATVGVFSGVMYQDYLSKRSRPPAELADYLSVGGSNSVVPGRVSYTFGFDGPSVAVDTACSSSLVALHLAVRSLRSRECDTAFVTGGMVMSTPAAFESYVIDGALSATGRCRAFSEDADGTAWGEGVGVLMLEPLSVALDRGREVLAVVRGTAINQDGRSSGLTAPNGPSQRRVIEAALADAGLEAGDVDVIEAHGTGTRLGDPIEAGALHSVYGRAHSPADPVHLGSVKSNIGHTQAAAGVASVIKMVQSLRHESLAPTLWVNEPSPRIEWDGSIELLTAPRPWIRGERVRRAGVSGFGFSGTNAHVLLEEAPAVARDVSSEDPPQRTVGESSAPGEAPTPIVLSAASASALAAQARRYGDWLASPAAASVTPGQLASALAGTRKRFRHRLGLCPPDLATAGELLRSAGAGTLDGVRTGEAVEGRGVVFVFPGQGAQWDGMGARLLDQSEVFRGAVAACAAAFGPELGFDLREELRQPMDGDAARVQPLLFAMSIGLARLWESVGVRPDAVVAASLGEPAALHVAGALTLEQAAAVALRRARLLATMPGDLRMLVCQLSSAAATDLLAEMGLSDSVDQLVENSPQNILLGGAEDEIRRIAALLDERGVWCRPLKDARLASHSRWVDPLRDDFLAQLSAISPTKASIPVYSATFGRRVDTASLDAGFWFDNARGRVRMREALDAVFSDGYACLVECSPHPVMHLAIEETAEAGGHRCGVVASIHRGDGGLDDFTREVTGLAVIADVDLEGSPSRADDRPVALPTYAFDTTRLFHASVDPDLSGAGLSHTEHPVLGAAVQVAGDRAAVLLGRFSLADQPWLSGHRVDGRILVPGVAFLELSLFAGMRLGCDRIDELVLTAPLDVTVGARQVQVVLEPVEGNPASRRVTISSRRDRDDDWQDHATGTLSSRRGPGPDTAEPIEMGSVVDGEELYDAFAERGITYGDPFRGVTRTGETPGAVHAEVVLAEHERPDGFLLHPALMDASLHALGRAFADSGETGVPYVFSGVEVYAEKATTLRVDLSTTGDATARIRAYDPAGHPVFLIDRIEVRALPAASAVDRVRGAGDLYVLDWRSYTGTTDTRRPDRVLDVDVAGGDAVRACDELLPVFQEWLESDGGLLLVRTVGAHGRPDPATAALQGIVRAAQQEHPGRLQLVDVDVDAATGITEFPRALDEAVVVDGRVLARHLRKVETVAATDVRFEPGSTALISGGGAIGAVIAEQLVRRHGVQRILIGSRGGADSEANTRLAETLRELGAEVDITAVDLGDLRSVRAMVSRVPDEHPIGVVVHTAGVLDDGVLASMGADRLRRVFTPKLTAVENLHRALSDRSVERFVVCSSAASVFGPPGQANYTAANAALDAWCAGRAAEGFPALSLAWGPWEAETTRASAHAGSRTGLAPYRSDTGAEAFSRALAADAGPVLFPLALDRPELRRQAETGGAHELLEELLGPRPSAGPRIAARAASTTGSVDDLVRGVSDVVASVLGHGPGEPLDDRSAFRDLGIDSLTALQVRNRLAAMFDVTLPVSLVFDHPNIRAVATLLRELASGEESDDSRPVTTDRRDLDGERVAIVSMACRYPGGVTSPEGLWDLVEGGVNAVGPMPTDRGWELSELIDPTGTRPGTSLVGTGAFVDSPFDFDPALFSISPREALAMDPVQRLSLELAWEALEQAGIAPDSLAGSATGVYLGVMYQDYGSRFDVVPPQMQAYVGNGNAPSVASGRISYTFGLNGPALTVDTACSSSLVAIHLACRSLLEGETDLALAGGGTIMSTPALFINFSGIRGISSDGACHTFSERADGAGLGEGVGLVALERLSDAERLGHPVLAVIEGSAVNQDGASNGLTAPNGPAQQKVIAAALEQAGLAPS
ncbi:type I polyketide synthase, partial [Dietzia sp. B19]|uniref:type I polyketide synthase n=1 Tax=Dietzia sp. B19 TaxID=1630632 RepID=UPI0015FBE51B